MKILLIFFCLLATILAQVNYDLSADNLEFGPGFSQRGPVDGGYAAGEDVLLPPLGDDEVVY